MGVVNTRSPGTNDHEPPANLKDNGKIDNESTVNSHVTSATVYDHAPGAIEYVIHHTPSNNVNHWLTFPIVRVERCTVAVRSNRFVVVQGGPTVERIIRALTLMALITIRFFRKD